MQDLGWVALVVGTLAAVIRWLLQVWFKQSAELEKLRSSVISGSIDKLDDIVTDHKKSINTLDQDVRVLKDEIKKFVHQNAKSTEEWARFSEKLDRYIAENQERTATIETEIHRITKDLVLVKGKIIEKNK